MRFSFLIIMLLIMACSESTVKPDTDRLGLNYFPLEVGSFRIYDVEEVLFTVLLVDTSNFQLKESVVRKELDLSGDSAYVVYRESRLTDQDEWKLDSIWTAKQTGTTAVMVENNVPLLKMVFPIQNNATWDGNSLNGKISEFYRYNTALPDTVMNDTTFTALVQVVQSDRGEDFIGRDDRMEIYVQGIGLLIKESIILKFCQMECTGEKEIEAGRSLRQTLRSYGKE